MDDAREIAVLRAKLALSEFKRWELERDMDRYMPFRVTHPTALGTIGHESGAECQVCADALPRATLRLPWWRRLWRRVC